MQFLSLSKEEDQLQLYLLLLCTFRWRISNWNEKQLSIIHISRISINVQVGYYLEAFNEARKGFEINKHPFHGENPFSISPSCPQKSLRIYSDFILLSPSCVFIFNYDELSWRSLSDNTDNKLHICDNHLGEEELGKNLNCGEYSMDVCAFRREGDLLL